MCSCHDTSGYATVPPLATHTQPAWPKSICNKTWFKPVAQCHAEDAFWCPKEECVKNQSDLMLAAALDTEDGLYWEAKAEKPPSPKCKWNQVEEEYIDDLISTVKMAMSTKKHPNQPSRVPLLPPPNQRPKCTFKATLKQWPHKIPQFCNWWKWSLLFNKKTKWFFLILIN